MASPRKLRLEDQLCFALYAATNAVTRSYRPRLAGLGLTYPQYLVMIVLWQHGATTASEIAARLDLGANAMTPILDKLEDAGFVQRTRSAEDRRVVRVELTPGGRRLEEAASLAQQEVECRTLLDPEALAELRDELHALVRRMEEPEDAPSPSG